MEMEIVPPTTSGQFYCSQCDYITCKKRDFDIHLLTRKHQQRTNGIIGNKIVPPNDISSHKFTCETCQYTTYKQTLLDRHCLSQKHKKREQEQGQYQGQEESSIVFQCSCGNHYKTQSGLWKHKKQCMPTQCVPTQCMPTTQVVATDNTSNEIKMLTQLMIEVVKQNQEQGKQNQEFQKQIVNLIQQNGRIGDNINSHNVNSHNKFNLQFFLNETCKDALNIREFIDSVKISISDIENVGSVGYVEGISQIILNNLKQLDVTKRPIHCTDLKREIIHIKDNNAWERESEAKPKLIDSIKTIAHKNIRMIPEWKMANPHYKDANNKLNDKYMVIVNESMGACDANEDEKNYNKIIKKIAQETIIGK